MTPDISRREFLKTTTAMAAAVMAGGLMTENSLFASEKVSIPEVDRLTITVLTDNYYDTFRPDGAIVKRYSMLDALSGATIHAEHGLSYHIATEMNGSTHPFLFDYGQDDRGVERNMELLKIDLAKLEALGLSHGHLDHWANLVPLLQKHRSVFRRGIPLYVGEEAFAPRFVNRNNRLVSIGRLSREDIQALGFVTIREVGTPTPIVPGAYLTGEIERKTDYEKVQPYLMIQRGERVVQDTLRGEQSLVVNVRGKGLVVLTSCAHSGVINTTRHAQSITGIKKVHAVMGGFHLTGARPEIIARTIEDMKAIAPDYIVPMHCAGFEAQAAFAREMPREFILNTAGATYTFSATTKQDT
jgi:7,8-dihydropterin-6-yl-methyl-4-(beta-D-ribofuranosyl)aminobenzene 5'-phosphate synthase